MEVTFAEEYSAIHKGLLHYLGLIASISETYFLKDGSDIFTIGLFSTKDL